MYSNCELGTDCTDCGRRFQFPPSPPPIPPTLPPPPPPTPPPPLQLFGNVDAFPALDIAGDGDSEHVKEQELVTSQFEAQARKFEEQPPAGDVVIASGETFAAAVDGLLPSDADAARVLDWELVPVSFLDVTCRYGRKLHDGSACEPLSPTLGSGSTIDHEHQNPRIVESPSFSGVSYSSTYLVQKSAETPSLPWYGYRESDGQYGTWTKTPSRLISHAGYLLNFHAGRSSANLDLSACPLLFTYLRPGAKLWRSAPPPFAECCRSGSLNKACLPSWLQHALGNSSVLRAPGVLYDPKGRLPDRSGNQSMHLAIYYSTQHSTHGSGGLACIGRISGRWLGVDSTCTPVILWEDDGNPVLCSNSAASKQNGSEVVVDVSAGMKYNTSQAWKDNSHGEALAYGAEPYYGLDGSVYLVYGAQDPGHIKIVQLNETTGRLPKVAQPGGANYSFDAYHTAASGPDFELGADKKAPLSERAAYITGKIKPLASSSSLVQNAFVWPRIKNGTAEYYLFVEWFGNDSSFEEVNASLSRVYVGRSAGSPTGPFLDRVGNNMQSRTAAVLGDTRAISIVSAAWGANCDGTGLDVKAIAQLKCEGKSSCDWLLKHDELEPVDPRAYSNFDFPAAAQTVATRFGAEPNNYADREGCPRAINITYRCTKKTVVLYEGEMLGDEQSVSVEPEAANGQVVALACQTPPSVHVPGGSLFADSQKLGGNLYFATIGHAGVFSYERKRRTIDVFTFQYQTNRSTVPELGARRIRFAADGWPVLAEDYSAEWATCGVPQATYSRQAPSSYWKTEAHYDPEHSNEAHYLASSSSGTHCTHHSLRGSHCVGNSMRATHPQVGVAGREGSLLHGRIDEQGTAAYWRDQQEHCNPLVQTQLGRTLKCTRFAGKGDLNAANHTSTMERIQGCPRLACTRRFRCRADVQTRAAAGTLDTCSEGLECKRLPQIRVDAWDPAGFFDGGQPVLVTRDGLVRSDMSPLQRCHADPYISNINPALADAAGGTLVTIHGTGFGSPARCRFGWLETSAENVTSNLMLCRAPALNKTFSDATQHQGPQSIVLERLIRQPVLLEVSMMSKALLQGTPLTDAVREVRGENFTTSRFALQYYNPARMGISFLRPQGGPTAGGTHIDVHGSGFLPSDRNTNIKCRFGALGNHKIVPATFHNSERISCFSPQQTANFQAEFHITFNEQDFFGDKSNFSFFTLQNKSAENPTIASSVIISGLHPLGGPARGGTMLTLFGTGFKALDDPSGSKESFFNRNLHTSNHGYHDLHRSAVSRFGLFCLFHGVDVAIQGSSRPYLPALRRPVVVASLKSTEQIICMTPPYDRFEDHQQAMIAEVPVDITLNGNLDELTESGLNFTFYREDVHTLPKLHAVKPYGGPSIGGTLLTIFASNLITLTKLGTPLCRFGSEAENTTVPATIVVTTDGNQLVHCTSPLLPGEMANRDVSLNVAQNGHDYTRRSLRFRYYALEKFELHTLHPSGGPSSGGTQVLITGRHIGVSRGGLQCGFGSSWVTASSVDEHSLRCAAPAKPINVNSTSKYASVDVHITVNDDQTAVALSSRPFTYFEPNITLAISNIYPQAGSIAGGTWITVYGSGFRDLGGVFCRFGVSAPVRAVAPPPPLPPSPAPGIDGTVRLRNGGANWRQEGRVEIFHDGEWGTVCDDFWDIEDARTVCRQLGFPDALGTGFYGPGTGRIWLDNVNCGALKPDRLDECSSRGWGEHDCNHDSDAGVRCTPLPSNSTPSPPPRQPPPPLVPWSRRDDYQLTQSSHSAHLGKGAAKYVELLLSMNASEFDSFVCLSPPLQDALGRRDHRAITRDVELQVSINNDTFGVDLGRQYTYYAN